MQHADPLSAPDSPSVDKEKVGGAQRGLITTILWLIASAMLNKSNAPEAMWPAVVTRPSK